MVPSMHFSEQLTSPNTTCRLHENFRFQLWCFVSIFPVRPPTNFPVGFAKKLNARADTTAHEGSQRDKFFCRSLLAEKQSLHVHRRGKHRRETIKRKVVPVPPPVNPCQSITSPPLSGRLFGVVTDRPLLSTEVPSFHLPAPLTVWGPIFVGVIAASILTSSCQGRCLFGESVCAPMWLLRCTASTGSRFLRVIPVQSKSRFISVLSRVRKAKQATLSWMIKAMRSLLALLPAVLYAINAELRRIAPFIVTAYWTDILHRPGFPGFLLGRTP